MIVFTHASKQTIKRTFGAVKRPEALRIGDISEFIYLFFMFELNTLISILLMISWNLSSKF